MLCVSQRTAIACSSKAVSPPARSVGRGVWVPAFAGTTSWRGPKKIALIALANFAGLPCSGKFFYGAPWGFHASALTDRNISPGDSGRRLRKGEIHGCYQRRPASILGAWH